MNIGLIVLTLACFAGGILLARWQARRKLRDHVADRIAREVEKELARRAMEQYGQQAEKADGQSKGNNSSEN